MFTCWMTPSLRWMPMWGATSSTAASGACWARWVPAFLQSSIAFRAGLGAFEALCDVWPGWCSAGCPHLQYLVPPLTPPVFPLPLPRLPAPLQSTRVLVTHQLQYLPAADQVVVLRDGCLAEQGGYQELLARGVDFHQFELQKAAQSELEGGEGRRSRLPPRQPWRAAAAACRTAPATCRAGRSRPARQQPPQQALAAASAQRQRALRCSLMCRCWTCK